MILRHPVVLTSVEEDFRKIGLLPPLTEGRKNLAEVDDPMVPRDIPSPAPEAGAGLDDSEGNKSSKLAGAKQPKPSMGPSDETDDEYEPLADGGSKGAQKSKGGYKTVPHGKEASIKGESKGGAGAGAPRGGYALAKKQPAKKMKGGQPVRQATGLKPAKKIGGMHKEGTLGKAANLIEEVEQLLRGVQTDEEYDALMRGFGLVSESASLLADRLTEIGDKYQVEDLVSTMEELSRDAADTIGLIESELEPVGDEGDENAAIKNSAAVNYEDLDETDEEAEKDHDSEKPYDVPSPAFKEEAEKVFGAMVSNLMDALESYDHALVEMGHGEGDGEPEEGIISGIGRAVGGAAQAVGSGVKDMAGASDNEEQEEPDGDEGVHIHHHHHYGDGAEVHHHHDGAGGEGEPEGDGDEHAAAGDDDGGDEGDGGEGDPQDDDGGEGEPDDDEGGLSGRMASLRAKADKLRGGRSAPPFRGGKEEMGGGY